MLSTTTSSWSNVLAFLILAISAAVVKRAHTQRIRNPRNLPYPPGPKRYPVIGSFLDMPSQFPWLAYDKWKRKHGDMVYFEVFGQPILVLNSLKRANDLLDKRSRIYSDRMKATMLMDLMGWDFNIGLMAYGTRWRKNRRIFHEHFSSNAVNKYISIQTDQARALLVRLIDTPQNFVAHIRQAFGATVMKVTYGISVQDKDDPYLGLAESAIAGFNEAGTPGAFLVDFLPILKYVPAWFPGAGFQKKAAEWKSILPDLRMKPFKVVKDEMADGVAPVSVASEALEKLPLDHPAYEEEEEVIIDACAIAYAAGADTTTGAVHSFFLAMVKYPEVFQKAQEEMDRVIGRDRLPVMDDQELLPYTKAVCKELLRWHNILPLGFPHTSMEDDEYDGYFIPKGTIVVPNTWSICHNPDTFDDPLEFKPERYIKDGEFNTVTLDPTTAGAFGFGRRICPGRHLTYNSLFLIVSNIICGLTVLPPVDEDGKVIEVPYDVTPGLLCFPQPFECRIRPRSRKAEQLIRDL